MSDDFKFGGELFGYTTLVSDGRSFIGLSGDRVPDLRIGEQVVLLGESVPFGFRHGQKVRIAGFTEPFKDGKSDHIIEVTDGQHSGWIKPSNIQRPANNRQQGDANDMRYLAIRKLLQSSTADFADTVYSKMSSAERATLPSKVFEFVNTVVSFALDRLAEFGEKLAEFVARHYDESPYGERFINDPIRSNTIVNALLFLDHDGALISLKNATTVWNTSLPAELEIAGYESYEVLTGPLQGKKYLSQEAGHLSRPVYRSGRASAGSNSPGPVSKSLKVFLCHSSADKEVVRRLHSKLVRDGLRPWLDAEDLKPGQEWRPAIERAVRGSDVVMVCLSRSSVTKTGFVQREIALALDAATERPEGAIYIVPARLETCDVPERLGKWQWVDLFEPDGYLRLLNTLTVDSQQH
jgi:hypothetical protein